MFHGSIESERKPELPLCYNSRYFKEAEAWCLLPDISCSAGTAGFTCHLLCRCEEGTLTFELLVLSQIIESYLEGPMAAVFLGTFFCQKARCEIWSAIARQSS